MVAVSTFTFIASDSTDITSEEIEFMKSNLEKSIQFHRKTNNRLFLISHRGMGPTSVLGSTFPEKFLPENTIVAFKQAMLLGTDGIELDIFKSSDGKIMVVHDDELWKNVYGIKRDGSDFPEGETKESYRVSQKTSHDLKRLSMGPANEKMPELQEVFDLSRMINAIRLESQLKPVILNIEFKDGSATKSYLDQIEDYMIRYPDSGINFDSICFCSFKHQCLIELRKEAISRGIVNIQIAPGIKTSFIYGEENVGKDYRVKDGAVHNVTRLKSLQMLVEENNFTAYDGILWDMGDGLINLAIQGEKQIHAATSDFREYEVDIEFAIYLVNMSDVVITYLKCDEIENAMKILSETAEWLHEFEAERVSLIKEAESNEKSEITIGYLAHKKPSHPFSKKSP